MLSCFGVLSVFAADGSGSASTGAGYITVLVNRDFEDKKHISNGIGSIANNGNTFEIVKSGSNSYLRLVADSTVSDNSGYIQFNFTNDGMDYAPRSGSLVFSCDIAFEGDGVIDYGRALQFKTASGTFGEFLLVNDGKLSLAGKSTGISVNKGVFHRCYFVLNYDSSSSVTLDAWYDGVKVATNTYSATDAGFNCLRFGPTTGVDTSDYSNCGQSALIDNFLVYTSTAKITDPTKVSLNEKDQGVFFQPYGENIVDTGFFTEGLFMKTGVEYALCDGNKVTTLAPVKIADRVYVPLLSVAELLGYSVSYSGDVYTLVGERDIRLTVGNSYATVGGASVSLDAKVALLDKGADSYAVVALDDLGVIFGVVPEYSDMGLIAITDDGGILENYSMESLLELMKRFIFDHVGADGSEIHVFESGDMLSLDHPYILASQSEFDYYREVYNSDEPSELKDYLTAIVESAHAEYDARAAKKLAASSTYQGMGYYYTMPYTSTNGYDPAGGRQGEAANHMKRLVSVAFAYQLTHDVRLAMFAYQYTRQIGSWYHWGPGHFLNAADTMGPYALVYDMLYDAWTDLEASGASYPEQGQTLYVDVGYVRDALFINGVLTGYYAVDDIECPWARCVGGESKDDSHFSNSKNNWNAVCASGIATAALALMGDLSDVTDYTITQSVYENGQFTFTEGVNIQSLGDHRGFTTIQEYCEYLVNAVVYDLEVNGLGQYAPDGSYIESPSYWAYGTNNLFKLASYLENTIGTSYGLMDTWGLDKTCYFAMNTQSSDYLTWNFHDMGSAGAQDTSMFAYVASAHNNTELAYIRKHILKNGGSSPSIYDVLYYTDSDETFEMPALEYHMEGIDGFSVRDSWDRDSIYAGIMGGLNRCTHGQMDSGSFVYHNNGKIWLGDLGTESYNVYKFGSADLEGRYGYYVMSAQGNNTLTVTSRQGILPFGQKPFGGGTMYETYSNEYGSYALIDNSLAYGYDIVNYAKRGMLFTNDRKTVVIQDEVSFIEEETAYWFGHILQDAMISTDGRVAYLSDGETVIRATIVSDNESLKFTMMDTYTFVVDASHGPEYSLDKNGVKENDRTGAKKLAIKCENVKELKLAVVIEEIPFADKTVRLGYEWADMDSWVPTFDGRVAKDTLIEADYTGADEGSISTELGNLTLSVKDPSYGMKLSASDSTGASRISFLADADAVRGADLAGSVLVAEIDLYTLSTLPEGAALSLTGKGGEIFTVPLDSIVSVKDKWYRALIAVDGESEKAYLYVDGVYKTSFDVMLGSIKGLGLNVTVPEGALNKDATVAVDNSSVRYFSREYREAYLLPALTEGGSLATFRDVIKTYHKTAPLAAITSDGTVDIVYCSGSDTPIIDLDAKYVYSLEELEASLYNGAVVSFLRGVDAPYEVTRPITVYTGGYDVALRSDSYVCESTANNTYRFYQGSIEVKWYDYDGNLVSTKTLTGTDVVKCDAMVTGYGEISELYGDGKYSYKVKCGWAAERGGVALSDAELFATADRCEFYLTDSTANGLLYVTVDSNGTITGRYDLTKFASDIAAGYQRVSLARDITTNISSSSSKTTSLYLNGHALTYTEYWKAGSIPVPSGDEVKAAISKLTPATGKKFVYSASVVESGDELTLSPEQITSFSVKMNLTLHAGFDINMYVQKDVEGVTFNSFAIDGNTVGYENVSIDGAAYYKISVKNIGPQNASDGFMLTVSLTEGGKNYNVNIAFSLLDYVERIIETSNSSESVSLAANILKYVNEACEYAGKNDMKVKVLAERYRFKFTFTPVERQTSDLDEITDAFSSVQYNLKSIPRVRFNLKEGYNGTVAFAYVDDGEYKRVSYTVVDGRINGLGYVEIERKAYDLDGDIEIWTDGGYGVYNIVSYYTGLATEQNAITRLLNAMLAYCDSAKRYRNS